MKNLLNAEKIKNILRFQGFIRLGTRKQTTSKGIKTSRQGTVARLKEQYFE